MCCETRATAREQSVRRSGRWERALLQPLTRQGGQFDAVAPLFKTDSGDGGVEEFDDQVGGGAEGKIILPLTT